MLQSCDTLHQVTYMKTLCLCEENIYLIYNELVIHSSEYQGLQTFIEICKSCFYFIKCGTSGVALKILAFCSFF